MKIILSSVLFLMSMLFASCQISKKSKVAYDYSKYSLLIKTLDKLDTSVGTAFYFNYKNEYYLITCWHVITGGCEPYISSSDTAFSYSKKIGVGIYNEEKKIITAYAYTVIDKNDRKIYYHKKLNDSAYIDLAAFKVTLKEIPTTKIFDMNDVDTSSTFKAGDSILFHGYPVEDNRQPFIPREYKGIVLYDYPSDALSIFFDYLGAEGCSGSPILIKKEGKFKLRAVYSAIYAPPGVPIRSVAINFSKVIEIIDYNEKKNR